PVSFWSPCPMKRPPTTARRIAMPNLMPEAFPSGSAHSLMGMHQVVIVGGGFGGLQAAKHLKGADVEVTLVDRRNFHLFQPLAYQVATGALAAGEVCYPLRAIFRGEDNVRVLLAEATGFELGARE